MRPFMRLRLHIREIAKSQGMSRTRLAQLAELNYATVNALWKDETDSVNVVTLEKIAGALKVPVTALYSRVEDE